MNSPDRPAAARVVALEHLLALLQIHLHGGRPQGADPLRDLAQRAGALLGARVGIAVRQADAWSIAAESDEERVLPPIDARSRFGELAAAASREAVCVPINNRDWTIAAYAPPRRGPANAALLVEGDWTSVGPTLQAVAGNIALTWQTLGAQAGQRFRTAAYGFARRLSAANGQQAVADVIARRMAQAVGARFAALALPDSSARHLAIIATHGYPLELVEHLRIEP